jgi:integrase
VSIHRAKSGKWEVRWRQGSRNRSRTFDRKPDAVRFDAEARRISQLGGVIPQRVGGTTFEDFAAEWLVSRNDLARRTRELYLQLIDVHLAPGLGHLPLGELRPSVLWTWQQDRLADGAGIVQLGKATTLLGQILDHAVRLELIPANPARTLRQPKQLRRVPVPLSPEEVEGMRTWMLSRERLGDATLISTLAYGGLRPGEALALRWADFDRDRLSVTKAIAYGEEKETKTGATRGVHLLRPLAQDLTTWRLATLRRGGLIWPRAKDAKPWERHDWQNWRRRWFSKAAEAIDRKGIRPYDLRHSAASLWISGGAPVTEVAQQLGHSPAVCLNTYAHLIDAARGRESADPETWIAEARGIGNEGAVRSSFGAG